MSYNVYIVKVKNIRPAENADKLNLCDVFGNTTVLDKTVNEKELYVYFPVDGQISEEFGKINNLFRYKDENGKQCGGFIDPVKRNIMAIRLRGNKSDGLILPLKSLEPFGDISVLKEGDIVSTFNGHEIACKYIPKANYKRAYNEKTNKTRKKKIPIAPLFAEHADTEQLAYNLSAFKPGDEIEITLKMHGTSQRTGYLPILKGYKDSYICKVGNSFRHILNKLIGKECYEDKHDGESIYEYDYVSGTRRTVLENYEGGFYGDNHFRQQHHDKFVGKLMKGETVYYEVVGFTDSGAPIMGNGKNEKLGKDFVKQYGKETVFSYGCDCAEQAWKENRGQDPDKPQSECYVYRMTMTNEDGFVVEYTPDFMRYRCEQMGVKYVPLLYRGRFPNAEYFKGRESNYLSKWVSYCAECLYDGPDPIGKTHIREGVVVRIVNRPKFTAFKHKNFNFKVLEGLIKDASNAPDMEEAQELIEN